MILLRTLLSLNLEPHRHWDRRLFVSRRNIPPLPKGEGRVDMTVFLLLLVVALILFTQPILSV
jgi:hypothetical protein